MVSGLTVRLCRDEIQGRPVGEAIRQEEATKINTSEIVKRRSVGGTVTPRVSVSYSETKIPSISAFARCVVALETSCLKLLNASM